MAGMAAFLKAKGLVVKMKAYKSIHVVGKILSDSGVFKFIHADSA